MKPLLRRILLVGSSLLAALFLLLLVLPFFFEDKLKALLKDQINAQVNARVDFSDLSLSLIRSFPDARVSLSGLSVANKGEFLGDTLLAASQIDVVVNLWSVFSGDTYEIRQVRLRQPRVDVHILPDGQANYDIALPDTASSPDPETASSPFRLDLQAYSLSEASIRYRDESLHMSASLEGLNHEGKGNFSDADFRLRTQTDIAQTSLTYDGVQYMKALPIQAQADLDIHAGEVLKVDFLENEFLFNRFPLQLDGSLAMPGEDIDMDLTLSSPGSDFGTLLSLVPQLFLTDLEGLQTRGQLAFSAGLKGLYNEQSFPAYRLALQVKDAFLQYPGVPEAVSDIAFDLNVENADGRDESLRLDLKEFRALLGSHPVLANLRLQNLISPTMQGRAMAKVNLADLVKVFPIESADLAGMFTLDASFDGRYDEATGAFPQISALMNLQNGLVRSKEYATELTDFRFEGTLQDPDGTLAGAVLDVPVFHFLLDGVPMDGSLKVENFDDPHYLVQAKGGLDLGKLFQLYPIDSMELSGKLKVNDLFAEGIYSQIEAEQYDRLVNKGSVEVESLFYRDLWYTQPGFSLSQGSAQFTPSKLSFQGMAGKLGKSSFTGNGYLSNYLAYLLMGSDELKGRISLASPSFDMNEWLVSEGTEGTEMTEMTEMTEGTEMTEAEEVPLEVYPIPAGYDLVMDLNLAEVKYDDLTLKNLSGLAEIKDQQLFLENVKMDLLGGSVAMGGTYDTRNPKRAGYDFFLDIANLGVKDAFRYFSVVKEFAPVARLIEGKCNLEVGLKGGLKPDFSPILDDLDAFGLFELLGTGLLQTPLTQTLAANTKVSDLSSWTLNDVKGAFQIDNGTLTFQPIALKVRDMVLSIGGAQNLAGVIRYDVNLDAPSGSLGTAAMQSLSQFTGGVLQPTERVQVNLLVTGTFLDPKVSGAGGGTGSQLQGQATAALEQELGNRLGTDVTLNQDSLRRQAQQARQRAEDSLRALGQQVKKQAQDTLAAMADSAKIQAQRALEEELKRQVGEDVTEKLKGLKDRVKLPRRP